MKDTKNNTNSERIRQGISANSNGKKHLKQYGRLPFGITPHLAKSKASKNALLLYIDLSQLLFRGAEALCTYPVADSTLAERVGLDARKIGDARRELAKKGIIQAYQFVTKQGKLVPGTWTYRLKFVSELSGESTEEQLPLPDDDSTPTTELPKNGNQDIGLPKIGNTHYQKSVTGIPKNGNGCYEKPVTDLERETSGNSDSGSVSSSSGEEWTNPSTITISTTTTKPPTHQAEEAEESDKADEWIKQQTYWSKQMEGTLAELHDHIKREFKLSSSISIFPDAYACRVMDALGQDKGGINYPQGYMNHRDGIAHLAKIAQAVQQKIKEQQEHQRAKQEEVKREKAKQQRKLEWEHRQTVFQGLGSQFDEDIQNSIKGVRIDSSAHPYSFGESGLLEGRIDTFLSNQEAIQPLYDQHVGTSLDSDGVIEREETLKELWARRVVGKKIDLQAYTEEEKPVMEQYLAQQQEEGYRKKRFFTESLWDWNQSGTRMGDFYDFIKQKILSDDQLQSKRTLDDDSKPKPPDTAISQMAKQSTKPSTPNRTKAEPREGLPPMEGGRFNEELKQGLIQQGIARLDSSPPDDYATWVNKMSTGKMLAEAGMTSSQLWKAVISQAGDKSSPKSNEVSQDQPLKSGVETA